MLVIITDSPLARRLGNGYLLVFSCFAFVGIFIASWHTGVILQACLAFAALIAALVRPRDLSRTCLAIASVGCVLWAVVAAQRISELKGINERLSIITGKSEYGVLKKPLPTLEWMHMALTDYNSEEITRWLHDAGAARICSLYVTASHVISAPGVYQDPDMLKQAMLSSTVPAWASDAVTPAAIASLQQAFRGKYPLPSLQVTESRVGVDKRAAEALKACTERFPALVGRS